MRRLTLGLLCATFLVYAGGAWLPAFFLRVHHLTLGQIGLPAAIAVGLGGGLGTLGGGMICDLLRPHVREVELKVLISALVCAVPALIATLFLADTVRALAAMGFYYLFAYAYLGPIVVLIQRQADDRTRAIAIGLCIAVSNIVTLGLGRAAGGRAQRCAEGRLRRGLHRLCAGLGPGADGPPSACSPSGAPARFPPGRPDMAAQHDRFALTRARGGETVFAIIQTIPSPTLSELAVWCGYDLVILDCEHGVVDEAAQLACLQVVSHSGAVCGVRLRPEDFAAVGRYLDWGADAILMADVKSLDVAAAFVAAATPGPQGTRSSTGSSRAKRYGLPGGRARPRPLLLALIESGEAVEGVEAIARTPGSRRAW